MTIRKVSRRGFLKGLAAGGLLLAFGTLARSASAETRGATGPLPRVPHDPLVWLAVAPDGRVTIVVARSEMGQGSRSTLAAAIADELEADLARVTIVQAEGDEARYGSQHTDGSTSIRNHLKAMREVGAAARQMLEAAAAARWGVPVAEVAGRAHAVHHAPSGRRLGYGELATAAFALPVPVEVRLKPRGELQVLGTAEVPHFDLRAMVTGRATFGADVRLPDMLVAVIARPPVLGGRLRAVEDAAARRVPGVVATVRLPDGPSPPGFAPLGGVAVVARDTWAAMRGREALALTWDHGERAGLDEVACREDLRALVSRPAREVLARGDWERARREAARVLEATYHMPHLAQAPMEPMVALAHVHDGGCEVWAPTQGPQEARSQVAGALGLPLERVRVHVTLLGGGFGRKSKPDFIVEAALVARAVGRPVRVQWTREDDLRHGYYHAASMQRLEAALDAGGRVTGLLHRTAFPSIASTFAPNLLLRAVVGTPVGPELGMGFTDLPYAIPHLRLEGALAEPAVRIGWYRAVANLQHAFATNSFVAEVAAATGRDPRALLLELLGPDRTFEAPHWNYDGAPSVHPVDTGRLRRVVEAVCERAGWGRKLPRGEGLGLAVHRSFLSYAAVVVHARVGRDGSLTLPRVDIALDCGFVANPDRVRAQLEGSVIMGLGNALHGAITLQEGRVEQSSFHDYAPLRLDAAPRQLNTWLLPSDHAPGGVGEAGVPPVAPALCNALFAATGRRIRELPVGSQLAPG